MSFLEILRFETRISAEQPIILTQEKLEHYLAHSCHFGHFSPGVRPFPPKAPIFQNSDIFANMAILGGLYVDEGDRQGKIFFSSGPHRCHVSSKKKWGTHKITSRKTTQILAKTRSRSLL